MTGCLALLAGTTEAQSAAERHDLRSFTDSIAAVDGSAASDLERLVAGGSGWSSRDPMAMLRRGTVHFRLGELGEGRDQLDRAEAMFDEAVFRAPDDWPWPWYALARAKLALASRDVIARATMHQPAGESYRSAALRALGHALEADPAFAPAATLLAEELLPLGERELSGELQRSVRLAARAGAGPEPELALGRVFRNLERPDSALAAFRKFVALGGDSGVGLLEAARSLHASGGAADAVRAYLAGADAAGARGRRAYRDDIAWIASPAELAAFDSLPGDSVGAWLHRFWESRDARELRGTGERLQEHLRRWNYAYLAFRLPPMPAWRTRLPREGAKEERDLPEALRSVPGAGEEISVGADIIRLYSASILAAAHAGNSIVDDRAGLYLRHGEPDAVAMTIARPRIPAGLSWKYSTTTGPLIFHFTCQNYCRLARMPPSFDGLIDLDARYERLAMAMVAGRPDALLVERLVRERTSNIATGLATDGFAPRFARQLDPRVQVFGVGDPARGTARAVLVFAIPGEGLASAALADGSGAVAYPLAMRLIATNADGIVHRIDTIRTFRAPGPLAAGAYLFGLAELPLGAGRWDVRMLFSQPGTDRGGAAGRLGVAMPATERLALSDLVLGREGSGLAWRAPDGPVPLNPLDAFAEGATAQVYYEARHLVPGMRYRTTIAVDGVSGDADGRVSLGFEETAAAAGQAFRRSIGLDRLKRGQYRLVITMERVGTGERASSERLINVLK